jgi:hypothetical protein
MTTPAERVDAKIDSLFPAEQRTMVRRLLASYSPPGDMSPDRIRLAILKLCEGNHERLPELLELARMDPRDVVGEAEYPRQMHHPPGMATEEMIQADRIDFEEWLEG